MVIRNTRMTPPDRVDPVSRIMELDPSADRYHANLDALFSAAATVSIGICFYDSNLRFVRVNEALAQMNGLAAANHIGKPIAEVLPHLAEQIEPFCRRVLHTAMSISNIEVWENPSARTDPQRCWLNSFFPVWLGQELGVGVVVQEITAQRQAEIAFQQQVERERLLTRISLRIRQSLHLREILNTTVVEIRQGLQADRVVINRCQPLNGSVIVAESASRQWQSLLGTTQTAWYRQRLPQYRRGITEVMENLQSPSLPEDLRHWAASLHIQSRLAIPILVANELWGVLAVHQCAAQRHWETFEIELLEQLATRLAIAIQQSELYQQVQQLKTDLENQVQARTLQLQQAFNFEATLKRITDRVRDSLDENQILQAVVRELATVMGVSCCNASLYDLEQGTSTTCYEYTTSISPYQGRVSYFSAVPELYDQLLKGQFFQFCSLQPNLERGLVAMFACPIEDDQGVIGDLWLIHHRHYAFDEQDIRLVQQVANQCAIAIRQARLYEAAQARTRELERLNQLKDDFLSTVSHELRTPLSNIKMAIRMLRAAPTSDRRDRYLEILETECTRETELINDLLDLQRLENDSYGIVPEEIKLQSWLREIVKPFQSRAQSRQQSLKVSIPDALPILMTDRKSLERILAELLNNACKYTPPKGEIRLEVAPVQYRATENSQSEAELTLIVFTVSNQSEVPTTELPRMFEKFYRIPKADPWQQGGTGLGLALVKKLIEMVQGSIEVSSRDGWTTFQVHMPRSIGIDG